MGPSAIGVLGAACALALLCHCKPPPATESSVPVQPALAAARFEVAKSRLSAHRPAEALAWISASLRAQPDFPEAREAALDLLRNHTWHQPESTTALGLPITALDFAPPSSLWIALGGPSSTVVRWNLESSRAEATFFPLPSEPIRSLTVDETGRFAVIERAATALLCDARTLKPIRDLGPVPEKNCPATVIAFSTDGLLLAHPAVSDAGVTWHIRETKSGSILRSSEAMPAGRPSGIAARLDREALTILLENGDRLRIPVSPVQAPTSIPQQPPLDLRHAAFLPEADAALALLESTPHQRPEPAIIDFTGGDAPPPPTLRLVELHPWNPGPTLWSGLLRDSPETISQAGNSILFPGSRIAELPCAAAPSALVRTAEQLLITGDTAGNLTLHRQLTPPQDATDLKPAALESLARMRLDESTGFIVSESVRPANLSADALAHLTERLVRAQARPGFPAIDEAFANADHEAVTAAITEAGPKGPAAAKCLELALASTHPEWIEACLAQAADLPELLRRIAVSRIAWLQDLKADAIAGWPDAFPDLARVRQLEDWDGWEAADFGPALEKLRLCVGEELAKLELPPHSTPEQRQTLFDHLADPATIIAVGKPRFAKACLNIALAFAAFPEETEKTFQLASFARNLGESPAICLRAEAMALTALGDFVQARDRWIDLITNYPVASHEPGDYAEAAYTSFENADPRQAMAILTTGIHRFPHDANFALRAGWVALLTGNPEPAYRYLLTGRQIGYPQEKLENATALMAIAAVQTGASEDAGVFYQELIRLDPAWEKPETIETLPWPEELKASLRQLAW